MFKVISSVGRSWPAHNFHVKVGDNEFENLTEGQLHFLQPFVDGGLMLVFNADQSLHTDEQKAKIADTADRIRTVAAAERRQRLALEEKAKAELWAPKVDGDVSPSADADKAKAEAEARARAEAEAKAKADADKAKAGGKGGKSDS